jgi:hypothetical protein
MPPKTWATNEVLTAADIDAALASTAWTAVTFTNGWVNVGAGWQTCQYRKVGDIVYIRGRIKSGTIGAAAFTLPAGFRPPASQQFIATSNDGATLAMMQILDTGTAAPATGSNLNVAFDIQFSVTA